MALRVALSERAGYSLKGLIHHSDKGSQYISNKYLKLLSDNTIAVSMCNSVYENSHIERVNGIIKSEYLHPLSIKSFNELSHKLPEAVRLYNEERPHWSLNLMTPAQYEEEIKKISVDQREVLVIYSEPKKHYAQLSIF